MGNIPPPENCPLANICAVTTEQAPPCGEVFEHFPQMVLAEKLCPRAVANRIEIEWGRSQDVGLHRFIQSETRAKTAWWMFEHGQSLPKNSEEANVQYERAFALADEVCNDPRSWFFDVLYAKYLHVYGPYLGMHKVGETPTTQDVAAIRRELGTLYDKLLNAPVHGPKSEHSEEAMLQPGHRHCLESEGERLGLATKLAGLMLAARQNIILYAGSPREAYGRAATDQNHDSFMLSEGVKLPVKILGRSRADARSLANQYDEKTTFINLKGLVAQTLDNMRTSDRRLFEDLKKQHYGRVPTLLDFGRMLRTEITGHNVDTNSRIFVDRVAERFEELLFAGRELPGVKIRPTWEILPSHVVERGPYVEDEEDVRTRLLAEAATHHYLQHGNGLLMPEQLQRYISIMRESQNPYIMNTCAGAYLDLASMSRDTPNEARQMVHAAGVLAEKFAVQNWQDVPEEYVHFIFRAKFQRAYEQKYLRALSGETPTMDDELKLYSDLLDAGAQTFTPETSVGEDEAAYIRGTQFEMAIHLLNARRNIRSGRMLQSMWPSLPREDDPHDSSKESRTGWDAAVTQGQFWDRDQATHLLQLKTIDMGQVYDPRITLLTGKDHLDGTRGREIIYLALREIRATSADEKRRVSAKLNKLERLFLNRLEETKDALST